MSAYNQRAYKANRAVVLLAAGGRCQIRLSGCLGKATTADHVLPVSQGGSNEVCNLRAACGHCNYTLAAAMTNDRRRQRRVGKRSRSW